MSEWQPVKGRQCNKCGSPAVMERLEPDGSHMRWRVRCSSCQFETEAPLDFTPEPLDVSSSTPVHPWYNAMTRTEQAEADAALELTKQHYRAAIHDSEHTATLLPRFNVNSKGEGIEANDAEAALETLNAIEASERVNPYGGLPQGDTGTFVTVRSSEAHDEGQRVKVQWPTEPGAYRQADAISRATLAEGDIPITVPRPTDVVDLRADLLRFWEKDTNLTRELAMQGRYSESEANYWDEGALSRRWIAGVLRDAELYWVSPDMCTLLQTVSDSMPDVTPEPPIPEALVVFARPLAGIDAMNGKTLHTAAYLWGPVRIKHVSALEIETFGWRELVSPQGFPQEEIERFRAVMPTKLISTGGSEWPWHELTSSFATIKGHTAQQEASMAEDRRKLAAFWSLCQDRITVERMDNGPRALQRRAARAKLPLKPVRVITLREAAPKHPAAQGREVDWSHRWLVGAYWRQQPYGPGNSLRRAKLIPAHVKGPADKPFIPRETVRALKR